MEQWTPINPREPWALRHETDMHLTATVYALAECGGVDHKTLDQTYETAKMYSTDRLEAYPRFEAFLKEVFYPYIANENNKSRLIQIIETGLKAGEMYPYSVRIALGFD